jgi:hypothetical protein
VASLLAVFLRNRGLGATRLNCWAFETPACMDLEMALGCNGARTASLALASRCAGQLA